MGLSESFQFPSSDHVSVTVPGRSFKSRGVLGLICVQGVPFSMTERSCSRKMNVLMETNHMLPSHLFCVLTATLHAGDSSSPQCAMRVYILTEKYYQLGVS